MKAFIPLLALALWARSSGAQIVGDYTYYRTYEPKEGTTADGVPWHTMPFVRGDSLRARMA